MKGGNIKRTSDVMTQAENQDSIKQKLGAASANAQSYTDGYLRKEDFAIFQNKQDKLSAATATNDGYLKKEDFIIFSNKQDKISTLEAFRTTDLNFTAGAYADVLSLDLTKGSWLVIANLSIKSPLNLGQRVSAKIWDGTAVSTSAESSNGALGVGLAAWINLSLSAFVVLTTTKTIKVSVASSAASILAATIGDYSTGAENKANSMRAIKIG